MNINAIIQVAIGIMFIWIALAMVTSQTQEWIASLFKTRAKMLEDAIGNLFSNDKDLKEKFYNHPLIRGLHTNRGNRKPGGIPEDKFALVLFDMIMSEGQDAETRSKSSFDQLINGIEKFKQQNFASKEIALSIETLLIGIDSKSSDALTQARKRVEGWFNNSMDRLSGSYRRHTQITALIVGIFMAALVNADTIAISKTLWRDPLIREAIVIQAGQLQLPEQQNTQAVTQEDIEASVNALEQLPIPIGWAQGNMPHNGIGWLIKIIGILITGVAAAQGAPYWFDLMKKLLNRDQGTAKK